MTRHEAREVFFPSLRLRHHGQAQLGRNEHGIRDPVDTEIEPIRGYPRVVRV